MILAIFFSRFHPEKGPIVQHQVPDGAIIPSVSSTVQKPLVDFSSISDYIIPRQEFCGQLVTVCSNRYRVLGCPICIVDPEKYDRNEFIFNFSIVLEEDTDMSSYQNVVLKLARLFRNLEERGSFLSKIDDNPLPPLGTDVVSEGNVYALCEMILEDLNNYCECMIPIDDAHTLNMKLFPTYPDPVPVKPWHVPLSTVRLENLVDSTWDLTMSTIVPFVDGLNSVAVIAKLADADLHLTCEAISHLLYYRCILLLDIFQFAAVYAPTPEINSLFGDELTQSECARYVSTSGEEVKPPTILKLYSSLRYGITLKAWCVENRALLMGVDVRRLVTFGVIKGFLYRVHKYALATNNPQHSETNIHPTSLQTMSERANEIRSDVTGLSFENSAVGQLKLLQSSLSRYLDGLHCFDEICTDLEISEKNLLTQLKGIGDIQLLHR